MPANWTLRWPCGPTMARSSTLRGRKVAGKENLRKFIQTNISRKIKQEPEAIQAVGDKVTWINRESNESYSKLNIAPVQQNSEILVRGGKIISWVNYFPYGENRQDRAGLFNTAGTGCSP
jgi:hypothetical protein